MPQCFDHTLVRSMRLTKGRDASLSRLQLILVVSRNDFLSLILQVRVVDRPLQISQNQLNLIEMMISEMRDPGTCKPSTVGNPRNDGSGYVDVYRPLQERNGDHDLIYCDSGDWSECGVHANACQFA